MIETQKGKNKKQWYDERNAKRGIIIMTIPLFTW